MSEDIFKHWSNLRTCDVYEPWKDKETHFSKYNAKNLENYMRKRIKEAFDPEHGYYRRTSVGLVDLPLMTYKRVDLDKIPRARVVEQAPKAVCASASMPGVFEAVEFRGNYSYDGGVVHYVDPESAIQRCLPLVDNDEKRIIMDVVLLDGEGIELLDKN